MEVPFSLKLFMLNIISMACWIVILAHKPFTEPLMNKPLVLTA